MNPAFFSSARMILLECHESPAVILHWLCVLYPTRSGCKEKSIQITHRWTIPQDAVWFDTKHFVYWRKFDMCHIHIGQDLVEFLAHWSRPCWIAFQHSTVCRWSRHHHSDVVKFHSHRLWFSWAMIFVYPRIWLFAHLTNSSSELNKLLLLTQKVLEMWSPRNRAGEHWETRAIRKVPKRETKLRLQCLFKGLSTTCLLERLVSRV